MIKNNKSTTENSLSKKEDDDHPITDNVDKQRSGQSLDAEGVLTSKINATNANVAKHSSQSSKITSALHPLHMLRAPVHVYYSVVEGSARLQFILSMIASLAPHRGLLIHVASRPMAEYLYLLLSSVLKEELVPSHVEVLSDYDIHMSHNQDDDNNSNKENNMTSAQCNLCNEFNNIVINNDKTQSTSSAVLISCFGLVPLAGSIFVQYDAILDLPNFMHFVSEVLTPGAYKSNNNKNTIVSDNVASKMNENIENNKVEIEQITHVQSRKRSISPTPRRHCSSRVQGQMHNNVNTTRNVETNILIRKRTRSTSPTPLSQAHEFNKCNKPECNDEEMIVSNMCYTAENATNHALDDNNNNNVVEVVEHAHYKHIIVLLRQHELSSVLHYWNADAKRLHIELSYLPHKVSTTHYLHEVHKLQSKQRKVFTLQNTAYEAYKATMTIYSSLSPHNVYDVNKLKLQKVGEEFGYTTSPPLLDLRLKSNAFRPREDYYKAALQKREHERREYKTFAQKRIHGELPEVHDTERHEKVSTNNKKKKRRKY